MCRLYSNVPMVQRRCVLNRLFIVLIQGRCEIHIHPSRPRWRLWSGAFFRGRGKNPYHSVKSVYHPNLGGPPKFSTGINSMALSSLRRFFVSLCIIALCWPTPVFAQQHKPGKLVLTVDSIMRGPDLIGYEPTRVYWSENSERIYFRWKRAGEPRLKEPDLYVVQGKDFLRDSSGLRNLSEDEAKQAPPLLGDRSKDKKLSVYTDEGDIFIYDHTKNERRQITQTFDGESNPRFTGDQKHITFTRQNNLYRIALDGGSLVQLTDIRTGSTGSGDAAPPKSTASHEVIKKEERELIEAVRERAKNREEQEDRRKRREKRKPFSLPSGQSVSNLNLSPDGKFIIATILGPPTGAKPAIVPNFVTESAYT